MIRSFAQIPESRNHLAVFCSGLAARSFKRFDFKCPTNMVAQGMLEAIAKCHDAPMSAQ
jgi:hypothetical protein